MNKELLSNIGLPKWPAIVVVGKPVTQEQASEINIRTTNLRFSTNDYAFIKDLYSPLGIDVPSTYFSFYDDKYKVQNEMVSKIEKDTHNFADKLYYLENYNILSSWIGGPHGWCDWNGNIGCNNYNIGKYPSATEVLEEWKLIAKAFPFLELKCQLFNCESGEDDITPEALIQFNIKNGKVTTSKPKKVLLYPRGLNESDFMNILSHGRERGCNVGQFITAIASCKQKFIIKNQMLQTNG